MNAVRTTKRPRTATMMLYLAPAAVVAGGLVAGAAVQASASPAKANATASVTTRTEVIVRSEKTAKFGTILVDAKGFALYTFPKDTKNHSTVSGELLSFWPALVVAPGVTPVASHLSGLGITMRSNGQHQVSYHGKPLYLFVGDTKKGEVTGQGVSGFSVATVGSGPAAPSSTGATGSTYTGATGSTSTGATSSSTSTSSVTTTTSPASSTSGGGW